jgi:hypothetical protein
MKKRINITVDEHIFQEFRRYCFENHTKVSTEINKFMSLKTK